MAAKVELLPIDADEFLSEIQASIDKANDPVSAVSFSTVWPDKNSSREKPTTREPAGFEEDFCENDYLASNHDVAEAIERGEFRSGFEHWIKRGRDEGRGWLPKTPSGQHLLEHGRVGAQKTRETMPILISRLKGLCTDLDANLSEIGKVPATPRTFRGAIGRLFIMVLNRALWWYTRSLAAFASTVSRISKEQVDALAQLTIAQEAIPDIDARLQRLATRQKYLEMRMFQFESEARSAAGATNTLQSEVAPAGFSRQLEIGLAAETTAREILAKRLEAAISRSESLRSHCDALQHYAQQTRAELSLQSGRITLLLDEARKRLPLSFDHEQIEALCQAGANNMDALYLAFEDAFLGSREEVKARQSVYIPHLSAAQAGTPDQPILDLGCGRGEWLELLREHDMTGRGIDCNVAMIDLCRSLDLNVEKSDVLSYLRSLPDASLGAITAFHVMEHIPFETILLLLQESLRVLKPGAMLILETPNPGNLAVGAHTFYLDPMHQKPLPIAMLRFFVEAKGFSKCEVLELQRRPVPPGNGDDPATQILNRLLYEPQDYAILAHRP